MNQTKYSFTGRDWKVENREFLHKHDKLSKVALEILYNRGIIGHDAVDRFLNTTIQNTMPDPFALKDMERAAQRICRAVTNRERILVFGDYDVDGVSSSCLMVMFLRELGCDPKYFLPNRFTNGYGFSEKSLQFIGGSYDLIIVLDSGVNAVGAVDIANSMGMDVVILDHHIQSVDVLPNAVAVVNPNRRDQDEVDGSFIKYLCAAGVTFLAMVAIRRILGLRSMSLDKYVSVVALGTLCDVMVLRGFNRAIVKYALMNPNYISGLQAMLSSCGMDVARIADDYSFFVGPLINAAGRLQDPTIALEILLQDDFIEATRMVVALQEINKTRKDLEHSIVQEATSFVESSPDRKNAVCVWGDRWSEGLIGIVAGKMKDKYRKPSFAVAVNGDRGKGSARSIHGVNLEHIFRKAINEGLLIAGGGHAMAGGFEIDMSKIDQFANFFDQHCAHEKDNSLVVDSVLTIESDFDRIGSDLDTLEPFGNGFAKPIFLFRGVSVLYTKVSNNERHMILTLKSSLSGKTMRAIIFNMQFKQNLIDGINAHVGDLVDVVGYLNFSKDFGVSVMIEDIRLS